MSRRKLVILSLLTAAMATLWFVVSEPAEPTLRGKTLFQWLRDGLPPRTPEDAFNPSVEYLQLRPEVLEIGTNAIPTLLRWIDAKPPPFEGLLVVLYALLHGPKEGIPPSVATQWDKIRLKQAMAVRLFQEFGTDGFSGSAGLHQIMSRSDSDWNRIVAMRALAGLGPSAQRFLAAALTNNVGIHPSEVLGAISKIRPLESISPALISALVDTTRSREPSVQMRAAALLLRLRNDPTNWIHVLQGTLRTPTDPIATMWFLPETRSQLREAGPAYSGKVSRLLTPADRESLQEFDRRMNKVGLQTADEN